MFFKNNFQYLIDVDDVDVVVVDDISGHVHVHCKNKKVQKTSCCGFMIRIIFFCSFTLSFTNSFFFAAQIFLFWMSEDNLFLFLSLQLRITNRPQTSHYTSRRRRRSFVSDFQRLWASPIGNNTLSLSGSCDVVLSRPAERH